MNERISLAGDKYSGFAIFMHWLIAVLVLAMIPIGIIMGSLDAGPLQDGLYTMHRSFGILVLMLMLVRLGYRLIHGAPPPEPTLNAAQRTVSHIVHMALYALIIAQALIGWAATSAYGAAISFFGLFTVPPILAKDEAISTSLFFTHELLGFTIAGLLVLHIGAALYHFVVRGDGVLQRMVP
ncbi:MULTISPECIES: cytochrome b [Rhodomicrobium]|uniref:cytochrome b n=1 Tax=Rhodomicrobium TaxID=1068 RepID=UPI000B4BC986|nr:MULTISPECIES: cytochrome b [Rhodomicrobium]